MNLQQLLNFSWVTDATAWVGLLTLVALEIVLGIDNIVFISILSGKLPEAEQPRARKLGLILAVIPRLLLLLFLPIVLSLDQPIIRLPFELPGNHEGPLGLSIQDLIIFVGGLFLLAKATREIHHNLEGEEHHVDEAGVVTKKTASFSSVIASVMLLNIVFSLDSIITAIGMVPKEQITVMVLAVLVSTAIMAFAVNSVSKFVERHPTVKMLALSFLLLIGMTLVAEGLHVEIPKGYVYFAMGFSVFVEMLNLRAAKSKKTAPVQLRTTSPDQYLRP
ncbi:MAG: TerC family protein [Capsulimonadales bacterium]|nr:TerC family protein [Capsulimonadales bacterium]